MSKRLLAILLSICLIAVSLPLSAVMAVTPDWVGSGIYSQDFEGVTSLSLAYPWRTESGSGVVTNPFQNGYNTSATDKVFTVTSLASWEDSFKYGEFSVFTPDIWTDVASNSLNLRQASFDTTLHNSISFGHIYIFTITTMKKNFQVCIFIWRITVD